MSKATTPPGFGFGEDEEMLRDLARKFLDEKLPVEALRKLVAEAPEPVYDHGQRPPWAPGLWKQIVELGWAGLAVEEADGGAGISMAGIAGLVEEVGRHALPSPLISTLSAALVLRSAASAPGREQLRRIALGTTAALAITPASGSWEPGDCGITGTRQGDGYLLNGSAHFVQDAFKADFFVGTARVDDELLLFALPSEAEGVSLEQDHIHDLTRDQGTLRLSDVRLSAKDVVSPNGEEVLQRAWPGLLVLVSADLCGTSEWQLQTTVEYAKNRKQFDHPLGFFQAVKHPLVNAMVEIDRARSLLYHAACCIDMGSPESLEAACMAKSAASDAGAFISDRSVQLHGGIGFTWECDVHIYFKRSMHNQALLGDGVHQRRKLADRLIGPIGATAEKEMA